MSESGVGVQIRAPLFTELWRLGPLFAGLLPPGARRSIRAPVIEEPFMKSPITVVACLLAVGLVGEVSAQSCPGGTTQVANVGALVSSHTLCAARGGDRWQEYHSGGSGGGPLIDYKKGPSDAVDPTTTVGTWAATSGANSVLTHSYTGGSSFSWLVCQAGSTYTLVSTGGAGNIPATIIPGQGSCP